MTDFRKYTLTTRFLAIDGPSDVFAGGHAGIKRAREAFGDPSDLYDSCYPIFEGIRKLGVGESVVFPNGVCVRRTE